MLYLILQIVVVAATALFCYLFARDLARKYVGHNPSATSLWKRIKAWWPGFVKRHIVDYDPYDK